MFYPKGLRQADELAYAAERLTSIEVNGSFYALQQPANWQRWRDAMPDGFVFAVKGPRFITHIKRLDDIDAPLANFLASGVLALGEKLGPLLWQLPPNLAFDEPLLDALPRPPAAHARRRGGAARHRDERMSGRSSYALRAAPDRPVEHAVEVRHPSFEAEEAWVSLLERHDVASVAADTAGRYPRIDRTTADFAYARLHGERELYVSGYDDAGLDRWEAWVRGHLAAGRSAYVYFDNDMKVRAPFDAMALIARLRSPTLTGRSPCRAAPWCNDREMAKEHDPVVPELTDAQWDRLSRYGVAVDVAVGDILFRTGDRWYDLILVESGEVEVVRDALPWVGETSIVDARPAHVRRRARTAERTARVPHGTGLGGRAGCSASTTRRCNGSWPRTTSSATSCCARCGRAGTPCGAALRRCR